MSGDQGGPEAHRWRRGRVHGAWCLLPAAAAAAYAVAVAVRMRPLVESTVVLNADAAGPMVMADALAGPRHGTAYFATRSPYGTLLLDAATRPLPDHRLMWLAWPYLAYLAAVALLGFTAQRVAGWRAALLTAAVATAVAPAALAAVVAQEYHGLTAVATVLLAALMVLLARGGRWRLLLPTAIAVGVIAGIQLASDTLLLAAGVVPFGVTAAVLWAGWRDDAARRMALLCGVTLLTLTLAATVTLSLGSRLGFRDHALPLRAEAAGALPHQVGVVGAVGAASLGFPPDPATADYLGEPLLGLGVVLCVVVAGAAAVAVRGALRSRPAADASTTDAAMAPLRRARIAHATMWTAVAGSTVATLTLTNLAVDESGLRYALVLIPALAVALGLAASRGGRAPGAACLVATAVIALNTQALVRDDADRPVGGLAAALGTHPAQPIVARLVDVLRSRGVAKAYAGYWLADSVTWADDGRVAVRPVFQSAGDCDSADAARLCAIDWYSLSDWFDADPGPCAVITSPGMSPSLAPSAAYGAPTHVDHVGTLTVYVYDHDLAPLADHYDAPATQR